MDYDTVWKRLFGLPIVVEHLLRGFIAPAAQWLAFGTLRELSASWTDNGHEQRHGDAAWRVNYADHANGSCRSLVLLLEFQSGVDKSMSSRVQRYKGMAYEELRRQGECDPCGELRLLPVVIHSGERRWTAPGGIAEISVADDGEILLPLPYSYLSLDVRRLPQDHLPSRNIVATVFELETLKSLADMVARVQDLQDWLPDVANKATTDMGPHNDRGAGFDLEAEFLSGFERRHSTCRVATGITRTGEQGVFIGGKSEAVGSRVVAAGH